MGEIIHSDLNFPANQTQNQEIDKTMQRNSLFPLIKSLFSYFPAFICRSVQRWFMWGYWCPRLNTLRLRAASSLLSFTQLKRIKVCFFSPEHNYRVRVSHSRVLEAQQWRRKNLFIRLWLPEHCPVETAGKQTHREKINPNSSPYSFLLLFDYRCIQSCVSHSDARLDFLFTVKLYYLEQRFALIVTHFLLLAD